MLNNFIYAQTKDLFLEKLNAGEVLDEAIVFIEDTKEIWNHGHYFAGESIDPELLEQIQTSIQELKASVNDNPFEKVDAENSAVLKGGNNQTTSECEVALGKYNASNYDTQFSIGIGTSEDDRKNAFEVKRNGDIYIEGVEGRIQDKLDKLVEITYSELKSLRDSSQLIPGQQYRITDYITTTVQENTQSAGHQFDIIVTADDVNVLNENARAIQHEGDTYFSNSDLNAWELKYCLDNDVERFAWALSNDKVHVICYSGGDLPPEIDGRIITPNVIDEELYIEGYKVLYTYTLTDGSDVMFTSDGNIFSESERQIGVYNFVSGKGVIYRMIDEWGNDCPYDFKNIQFKRFAVTAYDKVPSLVVDNEENYEGYYYGALGLSGQQVITGAIYGKDFVWVHTFALKDLATETWHDYTILNSIGLKTDESVIITCHSNVIKEYRDEYLGEHGRKTIWLNNIVFFNCYADISSPDSCDTYSYCYSNSFENDCESNTFGNFCYSNSFGDGCDANTFGIGCYSNSLGNDCDSNSLGNYCDSNSFGIGCYDNSFGSYCNYNSFGNGCSSNSFRSSASKTSSLKAYCQYNHFDDGCCYNVIWYSNTTSNSVLLKNINVNRGVSGTASNYNFINIDTINSEKEINVINYNGHIYIDYGDIFKVTYSELWNLKENSQLIPGRQYRIIDYNTTTSQENTTSAGHPFDIIVTAIDDSILSEEAQAAQNHDDNGYFDDSNLSAWKIWYSFDNDTDRFEWADDERIETTTVETIVADSSECTIKSELIDGNTFITPFNFESCVWVDANGDGETYADEINHDAAELVYEWGYFTDENDNTHLCLYKSDAGLYEEEGQPDYGDKYLYRGVIDVDGTDYDYWQKWDASIESIDINGSGDYVFATTTRIVSNPEAYSSETTTETIETVIPLEPKGVIYRMIDEFGNDLPYDFKNIMFVRYKLEAPEEYIAEGNDTLWMQQLCNNVRAMFDAGVRSFVWAGTTDYDKYWEDDMGQIRSHTTGEKLAFFTFNTEEDTDASLSGSTHDNKMQLSHALPNNVFFGDDCYYNSFGNSCNSNSFGNYCYSNSFGNDCNSNSFGNDCNYNSFGNDCNYNSFGNSCNSNSFGNDCYYNSFGNYCYSNSFGNYCNYNSFGNSCNSNSFGNSCNSNSFGNYCYSNSFGNYCYSNSFGNYCYSNSFGNDCYYNSFRTSASKTGTLLNYCHYNHFDDGCFYNVIWNSDTTSSSVQLKNININRGTSGKLSNYNFINIDTLNVDYEIQVAKNSKGEIKIYCEADLIA